MRIYIRERNRYYTLDIYDIAVDMYLFLSVFLGIRPLMHKRETMLIVGGKPEFIKS